MFLMFWESSQQRTSRNFTTDLGPTQCAKLVIIKITTIIIIIVIIRKEKRKKRIKYEQKKVDWPRK